MAKQNTKKRRSSSFTFSAAVLGGLTAWGWNAYQRGKVGGADNVFRNLLFYITGLDYWSGTWHLEGLKYGAYPIAAGFAAHWVASKLGINRMIGRAGIPLVRI